MLGDVTFTMQPDSTVNSLIATRTIARSFIAVRSNRPEGASTRSRHRTAQDTVALWPELRPEEEGTSGHCSDIVNV